MAENGVTRRRFLSSGTLLGSAAAAGLVNPAVAREISEGVPWRAGEAAAPTAQPAGTYVFFTPEEAAFIEAAVARLIPTDEVGPGAREAGCSYFIDQQLAGPFGRAESWYMTGPWPKGSESQGYQSRLTPAATYRAAIPEIDRHCQASHGGKSFAKLADADADQVIADLEADKIKLENVSGSEFFQMLLQNTIEGFFADPIYGGNRNMVGWKLIGFPGARYDYSDFVERHNERFPLPPVGIRGRKEWSQG